ncbi:OLC1v1003429C2 [Oldenlandia corymbosa var. corymbosa]|uniref:OLC1v1003429C2 n=1 Tax=Oldenlandia corymbosa var. corymbosa TaxID=529605 RepID=A0AAV1DBA6_OLDCO|nr:OLC1v1003429C2 [Oldenlandia corymbosa var. corymbosa]
MADSEGRKQKEDGSARKEKKKKEEKRKQRHSGGGEEEVQGPPPKRTRENSSDVNFEQKSPWVNLQMILLLQNKHIDDSRKLETTFKYVQFRADNEEKEDVRTSRALETVSTSRLIVFVNNWIQDLLISSEKNIGDKGYDRQLETSGSCLDYRCWVILKFCFEESLKTNVSLQLKGEMLSVIDCVARDALIQLNSASKLACESSGFLDTVLNCVSMVLTCHGGIQNDSLDFWMTHLEKAFELLWKVRKKNLDDSKAGVLIIQFSCYLLEAFAKFLTVHPACKMKFQRFVDRLLEPLMNLLDELHLLPSKNNSGWTGNLLKLVEEVLSQGIFHPINIDGFLGLRSSIKYKGAPDSGKSRQNTVRSYHRHLFEKLEKITSQNGQPVGGVGELLHLFVNCVKKQNGISTIGEKGSNGCTLERGNTSGILNSETRNQLFDFFIQITEHFISRINSYAEEAELNGRTSLSDVLSMLRSANKLLASFKGENLYVRVEDTSEGAFINFLKFVYQTIMSFSARIKHPMLLSITSDYGFEKEVLFSIAKEIITALHHLIDIGYEVIGDDLEGLWVVTLTFTACSRSMIDVPDQHFLCSETLDLGCSLIDLYSELRQVNNSIFALSKAVRLLASALVENELYRSHSYSSYSTSLSGLICSAKFRLSVSNAIKTIPEGQSSACIHLLTSDIAESLNWLNAQLQSCHSSNSAELLGRILAELYTLILDSVIVTSGNSVTVGRSIEKLVSLISYSSTSKDSLQPDVMEKFFCVVSGGTHSWGASFDEDSVLCWILVFFFRLYLSSRSLYQEVISLVPPDLSIKMSNTMGVHTAYSGKDWLEGIFQYEEGYFFWINKPSATLLSIMHNVSNIYLQENLGTCPPLVYVLNALSIQRIIDLNGRLNSLEYLLAQKDKLEDSMPDDDSEISLLQKRTKKWRKCLLKMKQEASGLTKHIMHWLSSLIKSYPVSASYSNTLRENSSVCELQHKHNASWDISIGSLNLRSLQSSIWWIACQHVDIWCGHADKRDLQNFLTCLIGSGLSSGSPQMNKCRSNGDDELSDMENLTIHHISLELLSDIGHYEQRFLCRHIVSRVRRILESSLTSSDSEKGYLNSKPDWSEVIQSLETVSNGVSRGKKREKTNEALLTKLSPLGIQFAASRSINYPLCCALLNFLAWMPKDVLSSKSFSKLATCTLNVERFVVGSLLHRRKILFVGGHDDDLLQLFVTCRRILKSLCASCDGKMAEVRPSLMRVLSESSSSLLWLLNSLNAVTGIQTSSSEKCTASQVQDMLFSLTNHTSYVLMTIAKYQFQFARRFSRTESKENSYCSRDDDLLKSLTLLSEIFREHKKGYSSEKFGAAAELLKLKKLTSVLSCIQGFLWGLAFTLENTGAREDNNTVKLSKCNTESLSQVNRFLEECAKSLIDFLHSLFVEGDLNQSSEHCKTTDISESDTEVDDNTNAVPHETVLKQKPHTVNADVDSLLISVGLFNELCLKKTILQGLLRGENPDVALFLQQLLLSASAITRLKLEFKDTSLLENLIPILFGISKVLLMEFNNMVSMPPPYSFVLLDGVGKFLEALGYFFSSSSPTLSSKLFVKLIDLHLRSMGKCIVLEGKRATLASKELESNIKDPMNLITNNPQSFVSSGSCHYLGSFKAGLRMSFRVLVQKSPELLSSAIQATERAIVGVQDGCLSNYEICLGSSDGGTATSTVAGGIDCLDLLVELVAGRKRVKDAKKHFQGLVACLLNIILHLQGPDIYFETVNCDGICTSPDPGSMILACIDILRRVPGKHALFEIDASHVGQFLNIPGALFQNILQIQFFEAHRELDSLDRRYLLELYAGCCRLLCSVVKHCARETQHCCALLQNSVGTLLQCLEMVMIKNSAISRGNDFTWGIQDGVKCACSLRRVYEEIHQKKDLMGRYCHQLLASYILVYCGFGPRKMGIIREVDEALRPGIYALIDVCSADDLQRLHTEFGEGPCRSTLATLQNDYKLYFKYQGKV